MSKIEYPLVSVVVACYNHEKFVQDCIDSILRQTYQNIELIIIDDGSTDNSVKKIKEMVEQCKQRFTRFEFRYRPNKGLTATLNEALEWCKGEYYSPFASDDIMLSHKTKDQVDFLNKHPDFIGVFGGMKLIDSQNRELEKHLGNSKIYTFEQIIMHKHNLPAPTQMLRLKYLKDLGGYNPNIIIEDWYIWLHLSKKGNFYYKCEIYTLYRQHDNNLSKKFNKIHEGRYSVLSSFKDSLYYESAINNIKWMNARELFLYTRENKIKNLFKIIILNPVEFLKILKRKLF